MYRFGLWIASRGYRHPANCPSWQATKIHGELLKLGIAVAQSTVSVYMVPRRDRPLQTWKTFLRNHQSYGGDCVD
jgi:hypothetical protein